VALSALARRRGTLIIEPLVGEHFVRLERDSYG